MYKECLEKIKENPKFENDERTVKITHKREGNRVIPSQGDAYVRKQKTAKSQKVSRVHQKINSAQERMLAAAVDEE